MRFLGATLMLLCLSSPMQAWDQSGHRFTTKIAYTYLTEETKHTLFEILAQHPRYQEDFVGNMPREVLQGTLRQRQTWLLGQAAFWPDIARRLSRREREKYNRPSWHFIDGALIRGNATIQGNNYLNVDPFPARQAAPAESNVNKERISNIFQALDYNAAVLTDIASELEEKAIALCWILHLIGDIHQPLHTGSLFSVEIFPAGDRGGNGIETNGRTLHAVWDRALADLAADQLQVLLTDILQNPAAQLLTEPADWSTWMQESRVILRSNSVYNQQIRDVISTADRRGSTLAEIQLGERYIAEMKRIAINRLASGGMRLAAWLNQNPIP